MCNGSGNLMAQSVHLTETEWGILSRLLGRLGRPEFSVDVHDTLVWPEMFDAQMSEVMRPRPSLTFWNRPDSEAEVGFRLRVANATLEIHFQVPVEGTSGFFERRVKKWVECCLSFSGPQ
jgi:hypothetical protein